MSHLLLFSQGHAGLILKRIFQGVQTRALDGKETAIVSTPLPSVLLWSHLNPSSSWSLSYPAIQLPFSSTISHLLTIVYHLIVANSSLPRKQVKQRWGLVLLPLPNFLCELLFDKLVVPILHKWCGVFIMLSKLQFIIKTNVAPQPYQIRLPII